MPRRSYDQPECSIARALDIVGERWTLLVLRELLCGPRRYTDLTHALPGMGTNLLASRLRTLEEHGIVGKRSLPPPVSASVYELTDDGRAIEPALAALAAFGSRFATGRVVGSFDARQTILEMYMAFDGHAARGIDELYEYRVDGQVWWFQVELGEATSTIPITRTPDAVVETDGPTFMTLLRSRAPVDAAEIAAAGDSTAVTHAITLFRQS